VQPDQRGEVDHDPAVATTPHGAHGQPGRVDDGREIDVHDATPVAGIVRKQITTVTDAGDVGDDVEPTKYVDGRVDRSSEVVTIGHVASAEDDTVDHTSVADGLLGTFLVQVGEDDRCALPRQGDDGRPADPRRNPGDESCSGSPWDPSSSFVRADTTDAGAPPTLGRIMASPERVHSVSLGNTRWA
jgi:hypothetical protein